MLASYPHDSSPSASDNDAHNAAKTDDGDDKMSFL